MSSPERCSATRVTSQRSLPPRSAVPSRGYKTGRGRGSRSVAERAARRTDARERARGCGTYACYVPRSYGRRVSPRRSNQEERLIGTRQPRGFNMSMKVSVDESREEQRHGSRFMSSRSPRKDDIFFPPSATSCLPRGSCKVRSLYASALDACRKEELRCTLFCIRSLFRVLLSIKFSRTLWHLYTCI